jgi:uncharacterized membrane protein
VGDGTDRHRWQPHRLNALCDGVFSIAMTLLALEVQVPPQVRDRSAFLDQLPTLLGQLGAYALAFFVIGQFWQAHHRAMAGVPEVDDVDVRLTIALLAGVAALPVALSLVVRAGQIPEAVSLTAVLLGTCSLLSISVTRRALRHDRSGAGPVRRRRAAVRGLLTVGVALAAIPLAYLLTKSSYAPLVWWGFAVTGRLAQLLVPDRRHREPAASGAQADHQSARPSSRHDDDEPHAPTALPGHPPPPR